MRIHYYLLFTISTIFLHTAGAQALLESNAAKRSVGSRDTFSIQPFVGDTLVGRTQSFVQIELPSSQPAKTKTPEQIQELERVQSENTRQLQDLQQQKIREKNLRDSVRRYQGNERRYKILIAQLDSIIKVRDSMYAQVAIEKKAQEHNIIFKQAALQDNALQASLSEQRFNLLLLMEYLSKVYERLDSTEFVSNKKEFFDNIDKYKVRVVLLDDKRAILSRRQEDLNGTLSRIESLLTTPPIDTTQTRQVSALLKQYERLSKEVQQVKTDYDSLVAQSNRVVRSFKKIKTDKNVNLASLPFINSLRDFNDVSANLNLVGSAFRRGDSKEQQGAENDKPAEPGSKYVEAGFFTRVLNAQDSASPYKLLINDIGNYGAYVKMTLGFAPKGSKQYDRFGVNFSTTYGNKPVTRDTIKGIVDNFNTGLFHVRSGFELTLFKEVISGYFNVNGIIPISNDKLLKSRYAYRTDVVSFMDFGFRMLLQPAKGIEVGTTRLYFDLNFLVNSPQVRVFNPADRSAVIPNFRIGLRTSLGVL